MRRVLRFWSLLASIYFCVCGGPFGYEEVMEKGVIVGLFLTILTPLLWSVPAAMMSAELGSAIPLEGGYYIWVRRAMGGFSGFLCGWWTWVYTWIDTAIYPGLFAIYAAGLVKQFGPTVSLDQAPWLKWGVGMLVVVPVTVLNVFGTKRVGAFLLFLMPLLLAPFVVMVLIFSPRLSGGLPGTYHKAILDEKPSYGAFMAGLFIAMWNYQGWDSMSTIAAEVEEPQRLFPKVLGWGVPLVAVSYLLPVLVGIVAKPKQWDDGAWVEVARNVGGQWLAVLVALGGLIPAAGLFASNLLSNSRVPFVIAEHGYLPKICVQLHPRYGTPWVAILISAVFYSVFSFNTFKDLTDIDVIVYSSALILEFAALVLLRFKEPNLLRPYKIPGGWLGVGLVAILPTLLLCGAMLALFHPDGADAPKPGYILGFTAIVLLSGPAVWLMRPLWRNKDSAPVT